MRDRVRAPRTRSRVAFTARNRAARTALDAARGTEGGSTRQRPRYKKGGNAVYVTPWLAAGLIAVGIVSGVFGYIAWSSRGTHSQHSRCEPTTSVRAVRSRVLGEEWAKRYHYSPLAPKEPPEEGNPPRSLCHL